MASVQVYQHDVCLMSDPHYVPQECGRPVLDLHQHRPPHRADGCPVRGAGQWPRPRPALR